ncbi:MAG TPA: UDP-N-acetylmuramoyl-L-alanyl-D-glutamate--2,6-diaminopimelate ligase [Planctomycetota bacterium]|nr:UDP-N-acetylmuramoyl-L-alanyl-D-glutamate--2,6-diaminopimelate ligase [Planctomycetota bacterium]
MIRLQDLVDEFGGELSGCEGDVWIREVQLDSRDVQPGDLFVAVKGGREDGGAYVADAIARGAVAVLSRDAQGREGAGPVPGVAHWTHDHVREAAGHAAARAQGPPTRSLQIVGITGTNGKTTCAHLLGQLLEAAGLTPAVLGTAGHSLSGGRTEESTHTTPPAPETQRLLARHQRAGGKSVVMEVSSHALDQKRTAGVDFKVGVFTNLTRDHLDYHSGMDSYLAAKARLFENLASGTTAVLNKDDPAWEHLARVARTAGAEIITYSVQQAADFRASDLRTETDGSRFTFDGMGIFSTELRIPLRGRFNVQNALAAIAAAHCLGASPSANELAKGLATFQPVPGRMEPVPCPGRDLEVFVDYAHTPDALTHALGAAREGLRPHEERAPELWVVFGCGGDRDQGKREEMGRVAQAHSDRVVVTSDNPRSEDPASIAGDILRGLTHAQSDACTVELDRRKAIELALRQARPGDVILVAGKGHETRQTIGGEALPFDDRLVIQEALCAGSSA